MGDKSRAFGVCVQEKIHSRLDLSSRWTNEPAAVVAAHGEGDDEGLRRTGKSVSIAYLLFTYLLT